MIQPPLDLTPNTVADWLEACLLTDTGAVVDLRISEAALNDAFEEANIDDADLHLANLRAEIARRQSLMNGRYPVVRRGAGYKLRGTWEKYLPYSFLLLVSLNQLYPELAFGAGTANVPAEMFENLTGQALQRYCGGSVIRIGAPRRAPIPSAFPDAVRHVSEQLFERFGYGDLEDQQSGDDGVDIIVWKSFNDELDSQMIVLAQCAIGRDWQVKRSELDLSVWSEHIRWATKPLKAFAIPLLHELGGVWRETAVRGGIILDRARIITHLSKTPIPSQTQTKMRQWCTARMTAFRSLGA